MIMKANKQIGFIYKNNESIDKILKDGEVVFEKGFLREKTSTTLPITFGGVGKDLKDYKVYGNTIQSKLPSGYTQVDYIESSGTQYIDTGVNADYKLSVLTEFALMNLDSTSALVMGVIGGPAGNRKRHHFNFTTTQGLRYYYVENATTLINTSNINNNKHKYRIDIYNKEIQVDDGEITTISYDNFDTELNYWLFRRNSNVVSYMGYIPIKLYTFKMYYEDVLVRDFIPCYRNSDNEVGLYDLVNNVFYTNQGTGVFTYGSVAPTPDAPIEMVSCGDRTRNLFDKDNSNDLLNNVSINNATNVISNANGFYTLRIDCKPNTTYTISKVVSSRFIVAYSNNLTYTSGETLLGKVSNNSATDLTITTGENAKTLYVFYSNLSDETTYTLQEILDSIQIEEGSTATSYEPYGYKIPVNINNTITNIYLDEPLRKIGDYSDYIDFINGKVVRNIDEIVLDGDKTWQYTNNVFYSVNAITDYKTSNKNICLCNKYLSTQNVNNSSLVKTNNTCCFYINTTNIRFYIRDERFTSISDFKEWLSQNNVTVDYVLETLTEESITIPNIPTIDGNNTLNIETEITPSQVYIKYKSNT